MKIKKLTLLILTFALITLLNAIDLSNLSTNSSSLITVTVTGAVKHAGVYRLSFDARLSEAIEKANKNPIPTQPIIFTNETKSEKEESEEKNSIKSSFRAIKIIRKDNEIFVDLKRFYQLGDTSNNPYLKDGDIIFVPAAKEFVYISGEIVAPGQFEIIKGDKLSDIISLSLGLKNSAYKDSIDIIRYQKNHSDFKKFSVNYNKIKANPNDSDNILLQDGDRIFIKKIPKFQNNLTVSIQGEIKFPGDYLIKENKTTLLEILTKAGAPNEYADLKRAMLIRKSDRVLQDDFDPEFERLKLLSISDMTPDEYSYFKAKSKLLEGLVEVDFEKLWNTKDKKYDILLKDGDQIYIPDKRLTVEVLGQVKNPGKYTYINGKDYLYYINQAGGLALRPNKRHIRVIKYRTGTWAKPNQTAIKPGDKIFVPEKPRYDYVKITKDILQILTSAATLYFMRNSFK